MMAATPPIVETMRRHREAMTYALEHHCSLKDARFQVTLARWRAANDRLTARRSGATPDPSTPATRPQVRLPYKDDDA